MTDPLAYFLTWHTYGTWLQGESSGSVDRTHREYGREFVRPNAPLRTAHASRMSGDAVTLSEPMRVAAQDTIIEVCNHRNWTLLALHIRTTHAHAVVAAQCSPERVLNDFKSYATRALRHAGLVETDERIWARHGSTRYLWNADEVTAAIDYTVNRQGTPLTPKPLFCRSL
ncbi:MAG: hypothetical protein KDA86_10720 [Planctomycetaceae bacterium]|nr:hypothetical protein [Planctomycetaceae bacterium]